ncbi:hypothetical protein DMENIID0001_038400 [Sergentomyia squamirostris]
METVNKEENLDSIEEDIVKKPMILFELNDDCLLHVFSFCTYSHLCILEKVCTRFEDLVDLYYRTLTTIDMRFTNIDYLDLANMTKRSRQSLKTLKISLESLRLPNAYRSYICCILKYCKNLKHLYLIDFNLKTKSFNQTLSENMLTLETVKFVDCNVSDSIRSAFEQCKKLKSVHLANCEIKGTCLTALSNLTAVSLKNCTQMHAEPFIEFCKNNSTLRSLKLLNFDRLNQKCLNTIASDLVNLETLQIYQKIRLPGTDTYYLDFSVLNKLKNLTRVKVDVSSPSLRIFLEHLVQYNRLQYLTLGDRAATQDILTVLPKIKTLKSFIQDGNKDLLNFTDDILNGISCKHCLEEIKVRSSVLSGEAVIRFQQDCKKLKILNFVMKSKY